MPDAHRPLLDALRDWRKEIHSDEPSPEARRLRSQLRRARTLGEARLIGGLYRVLSDTDRPPYGADVLTVLLLPHIKTDTDAIPEGHPLRDLKDKSFAAVAARSDEGSRPRLSEPRFRRLLEHESVADLHQPLVRALRVTGGAASLSRLVRDLQSWDYHDRSPNADGDHPRTRWAHDYYTTLYA